jgi:phage tail-like protein
MPVRETDPFVQFTFSIEVQGQISGMFSEISGLASENEVVEQKAVDGKGIPYIVKVPGRLKFTDVTLKRGITKTKDFWEWRKLVENGDIASARKNATITMYDREYSPAAQWELINAWPVKVSGPQFQSDGNAFGMEEMTITFENYARKL